MRLRGQKKKKGVCSGSCISVQATEWTKQSKKIKHFFFLKQGQHFTMLIAIKKNQDRWLITAKPLLLILYILKDDHIEISFTANEPVLGVDSDDGKGSWILQGILLLSFKILYQNASLYNHINQIPLPPFIQLVQISCTHTCCHVWQQPLKYTK